MNVEADALRYDDLKQTSVFTGRVVLTKGTILIRGARIDVRTFLRQVHAELARRHRGAALLLVRIRVFAERDLVLAQELRGGRF